MTRARGAVQPSPEENERQQTIERADRALYRAKAEGRNRTVHYTSDLAS